jgi:hypothetical protein
VCCNFWYIALAPRPRIQKNLITNRCSCFSISQLWHPTDVSKFKASTTWRRKDKCKYHISLFLSLNHYFILISANLIPSQAIRPDERGERLFRHPIFLYFLYFLIDSLILSCTHWSIDSSIHWFTDFSCTHWFILSFVQIFLQAFVIILLSVEEKGIQWIVTILFLWKSRVRKSALPVSWRDSGVSVLGESKFQLILLKREGYQKRFCSTYLHSIVMVRSSEKWRQGSWPRDFGRFGGSILVYCSDYW